MWFKNSDAYDAMICVRNVCLLTDQDKTDITLFEFDEIIQIHLK